MIGLHWDLKVENDGFAQFYSKNMKFPYLNHCAGIFRFELSYQLLARSFRGQHLFLRNLKPAAYSSNFDEEGIFIL